MQNELICTKVVSLLSLYIDGKLSLMQKEFVDEHLKHCSKCREKYNNLKNLLDNLKNNYQEYEHIQGSRRSSNKKFFTYDRQNLSAYFDNELPFDECVKFKKYIVNNPLAREELQQVYELQKLLRKNFKNSQKKITQDFSKIITRKIYTKQKVRNYPDWAKAIALFVVILICASLFSVFYYVHNTNSQEPENIANIISHPVEKTQLK